MKNSNSRPNRDTVMARLFLVLLTFCILTGYIIYEIWRSNRQVETENITVSSSRLPKSFNGTRIALITDTHAEKCGVSVHRLVSLVRKESPNIIAIVGDLVDSSPNADFITNLVSGLSDVAPVYFVPGNHDYSRSSDYGRIIFELVEEAGGTVLQNQSVTLKCEDDTIRLLGIDDPNGAKDMISMSKAVSLVKKDNNDFLIMLNHRYDRADEAAALGVDLMLSGHAHGGLIRFPYTDGLYAPGHIWFPERTSGLYAVDNMQLVTSRGLGNSGVSFRIWNQLHLPIITLESSK